MLKELESQQFGFDTNFIDDYDDFQTVMIAEDKQGRIVVEIPDCIILPENIPHFKRLLECAARKAIFEKDQRGK